MMPTYIKLDYSVYGEDNSSYYEEDEYNHVDVSYSYSLKTFEVVDDKSFYDFVVDFAIDESETYYVLAVTYDTGDSFSTNTGNVKYIDLFKNQNIAEENAKMIRKHYKDYVDSGADEPSKLIIKTDSGKEYPYYPAWIGYFERLTDVYVLEVSQKKS